RGVLGPTVAVRDQPRLRAERFVAPAPALFGRWRRPVRPGSPGPVGPAPGWIAVGRDPAGVRGPPLHSELPGCVGAAGIRHPALPDLAVGTLPRRLARRGPACRLGGERRAGRRGPEPALLTSV